MLDLYTILRAGFVCLGLRILSYQFSCHKLGNEMIESNISIIDANYEQYMSMNRTLKATK